MNNNYAFVSGFGISYFVIDEYFAADPCDASVPVGVMDMNVIDVCYSVSIEVQSSGLRVSSLLWRSRQTVQRSGFIH